MLSSSGGPGLEAQQLAFGTQGGDLREDGAVVRVARLAAMDVGLQDLAAQLTALGALEEGPDARRLEREDHPLQPGLRRGLGGGGHLVRRQARQVLLLSTTSCMLVSFSRLAPNFTWRLDSSALMARKRSFCAGVRLAPPPGEVPVGLLEQRALLRIQLEEARCRYTALTRRKRASSSARSSQAASMGCTFSSKQNQQPFTNFCFFPNNVNPFPKKCYNSVSFFIIISQK